MGVNLTKVSTEINVPAVHGAFVSRSPAHLKPKRSLQSSSIASALNTTLLGLSQSPLEDPIWLLSDGLSNEEKKKVEEKISRSVFLLSVPNTSTLLESIIHLKNQLLLVFEGESHPKLSSDVRRFSELLSLALDEQEREFDKFIENSSENFPEELLRYKRYFADDFIIEERLGKFASFNPLKELKKGSILNYFDSGWGVSCAVFGNNASCTASSTSFNYPENSLSLNTPSILIDNIEEWLRQTFQSSLKGLSEVTLIAPTTPIAASFYSRLNVPVLIPDLFLGWSPILTLLGFLREAKPNSLLFDASSFPKVQTVYVSGI